ncbi:MAG: MBL fold metallo-hydrolase [Oscillospiraceae bacterium]
MKKIVIQWLGHSCFKLTFGEYTAVVDPYENGSVPGLSNLNVSAIDVFCSHKHHDHCAMNVVKQIRMFAPPPLITRVESFHDDEEGAKRGENTIQVFSYEGLSVAHFGDLGHLLTQEQVEKIGQVDVALLPVGGFYTMDGKTALQVAKQVGARVIIPMHYRTEDYGFDVINTLKSFTDLCENVTYYHTDTIEITRDTKAQVAVLKYMG